MPVPMSARPELVLASTSPRRRALLEEHGYSFTVVSPTGEEIAPTYLSPGEIVRYNAHLKACSVSRRFPESLVLGVDTVVAFGGEVLGKPRDLAHAEEMLARLNGETHEVFSGGWLECAGRRWRRGFLAVTRVRFHRRTAEERRAYLARIGPLDKAGSYAAQEDNGEMIAEVTGSFSNVIGLPMEALEEALAAYRP